MARLCPQFWTPPVRNAPASIAAQRHAAGSIRISRGPSCCCSSAIAGIAIRANFKIYLLLQFCSNWVEFFYNTQKTQTQKMMDQNFEIRILWFLRIFLKFSNRRRTVPLQPIWTIMVAAKLDHSRVLLTKFHQNRLTLKGRSASQRHTDRQTRLKIMALQICNRANDNHHNCLSISSVSRTQSNSTQRRHIQCQWSHRNINSVSTTTLGYSYVMVHSQCR